MRHLWLSLDVLKYILFFIFRHLFAIAPAGASFVWWAPSPAGKRSPGMLGRLPHPGDVDAPAFIWSPLLPWLPQLCTKRSSLHGCLWIQCYSQGRDLRPHRRNLWLHRVSEEWIFASAHSGLRAMLSPIHTAIWACDLEQWTAIGALAPLLHLFGPRPPHHLREASHLGRGAARRGSRLARVQGLRIDGEQAGLSISRCGRHDCRGVEVGLLDTRCWRASEAETTPCTFADRAQWWATAPQSLQGCEGPYKVERRVPSRWMAHRWTSLDMPPTSRRHGDAAIRKADDGRHALGPVQQCKLEWEPSSYACGPALQWWCAAPLPVSHHWSSTRPHVQRRRQRLRQEGAHLGAGKGRAKWPISTSRLWLRLSEQEAPHCHFWSQGVGEVAKQDDRRYHGGEARLCGRSALEAAHDGFIWPRSLPRCCGMYKFGLACRERWSNPCRIDQDGSSHWSYYSLSIAASGRDQRRAALAKRAKAAADGLTCPHPAQACRLPVLDCVWWQRLFSTGGAWAKKMLCIAHIHSYLLT